MRSDVAPHAGSAAEVLGWGGLVTDPIRIYGRRVIPVARLLDTHYQRAAQGQGPARDKTDVRLWSWPEFETAAPPIAVELTGMVAPARHWRTAVVMGALFTSLCPVAALLPRQEAVPVAELIRYRHGMGVVAVSEAGVDVLRDSPRWPARSLVDHRWVLEVVYAALLRHGVREDREAC